MDRQPRYRSRNKNKLFSRHRLLALGMLLLTLSACTSAVTATQEISTMTPPTARQEFPTQAMPSTSLPQPNQEVSPLATTESPTIELPTPAAFSLSSWPSTWPAESEIGAFGEDYLSNNMQAVENELSDGANQIEKARALLGDTPVNGSLTLIYTKPDGSYYGGSGTVVASGDILTATHLQPPEFTELKVIQPSTGMEWIFTPDQINVSTPLPRFGDITLTRVPDILGIQPVPVSTGNSCISNPPAEGTTFVTFASPYLPADNPNRSQNGYTPFVTAGSVTNVDGYTCITIGPEQYIPLSTPYIEGMSGGGNFVWENGEYVLAAVNSKAGPGSTTTDGTRALAAPVNESLIRALQLSLP